MRWSFWRGLQRRWLASDDTLQAAVASLRGQRAENQDNYLLFCDGQARLMRDGEPVTIVMPQWPSHRLRVAVFDGMGGHRDGRQVAEAAAEAMAGIPPLKNAADTRAAVLQLHHQLADRFARRHRQDNPGTTMVLAELDRRSRRGWLVSVGDSRVYRYRSAGTDWQQLTHDHTLAEFNWRDGDLDAAEYHRLRADGGQHLAQALAYGSWGIRYDDRSLKPFVHHPDLRLDLAGELPAERFEHADVKPLELAEGDYLLLASDGLWDGVGSGWAQPDASVELASLAQKIARASLQRGSRDNITVLLVAGI